LRVNFCLDRRCEDMVKEETGADIRIIPFKDEEIFGPCIYCGGKAKKVVYFARSY
jgi:prolyl-tRNA synthetase